MLISCEGIDGAGKGTQSQLLAKRLLANSIPFHSYSFPQYGLNPFSDAVAKYLNGRLGEATRLHPKVVSLLYAADRETVRDKLVEQSRGQSIVICDRYVESNLAHQAAHLMEEERSEFFSWAEQLEYVNFRLPRPDVSILLDVPPDVAHRSILEKSARQYTELARDIHEADLEYLNRCAHCYRELLYRDSRQWVIPRVLEADGSRRAATEVADDIWEQLSRAILMGDKSVADRDDG